MLDECLTVIKIFTQSIIVARTTILDGPARSFNTKVNKVNKVFDSPEELYIIPLTSQLQVLVCNYAYNLSAGGLPAKQDNQKAGDTNIMPHWRNIVCWQY
jgi:hypothetical protein